MIDYGNGMIFPSAWAYGPPDPPEPCDCGDCDFCLELEAEDHD